jgi:hypothetical protein
MVAKNPKNLTRFHGKGCPYCNVVMIVTGKQPLDRREATRDHAMVPKAGHLLPCLQQREGRFGAGRMAPQVGARR